MKTAVSIMFSFLLMLCFTACSQSSPQMKPESTNENISTSEHDIIPSANAVEDVIVFSDPVLEKMVKNSMGITEGDIHISEAEKVTELKLCVSSDAPESDKIHDISDLKYFKNLTTLDIGGNLVEDISVLSNFHDLQLIEAPDNKISDISAIAGLTKLNHAVFWKNSISDISAVAGLTELEVFSVTDNKVTDISPLRGLTKLFCLELRGNNIVDFSPIADLMPNIKESDGFQVIQPEDVIFFSDPVLEDWVRKAMDKPSGDITVADALKVTELNMIVEWQENIPYETQIHDISALRYFKNLFKLNLAGNSVKDISVVEYLPSLIILDLNGSTDYDLTPVSKLCNLKMLNISGWWGSDITPLSELKQLEWLNISYTNVKDIKPLTDLTNLNALYAQTLVEDFSPISKHINLKTLYIMTGVEDKYQPDLSMLKDIYLNLTDKNFEIK